MPLSIENIIQFNSGNDTSTGFSDPVTITLSSNTTAGSTVIIIATCDGDNATTGSLEGPSATTPAFGTYYTETFADTWNQLAVWVQRVNVGGETTWTIATSGTHAAQQVVWVALEVTGIGVNPFPMVNNLFPEGWVAFPTGKTINNTNTGVSSWSTGTSEKSAAYDVLALAFHSATSLSGTVPTLSGHTNGFVELVNATRSDASHSMALSVSYLPSLAVTEFESTVSASTSSYMCGYVLGFYGDEARFAPDFIVMFGAEIGNATNIATASGIGSWSAAPWDTVAGTPAIVTTTPRSGTYSLELSSSAATENLTWTTGSGTLAATSASNCNVGRINIYFPTALPTTDCEIWSTAAGAGGGSGTAQIWYRTASQKLAVKVGSTGTEVASSATVVAGQYIGVDYRHYCGGLGEHTYDWSIDYNANIADTTASVVQTSAVGGNTFADNIQIVRCGWQTARTATVRYDDIVISRTYGNYPIGDTRILPLKADAADTPTVTGSSANFRLFTANGTLATWTAAGTVAAIDDIPPVIGGSSDGVVQINIAAGDWVKIPWETYVAAPDFALRAMRWYVAGWATSTTTATIGIRSGDASDILWDTTVADHNFDNTAQRWVCGAHRDRSALAPYTLTQANLDAAYLEFGGSTDATPDIGILAAVAEVAIQPVVAIGIMELEDNAFNVYVKQDPKSDAVASYVVTTPAGTRGATFRHDLNEVPQSDVYVGPNTVQEITIGASSISEVTSAGLEPDPS